MVLSLLERILELTMVKSLNGRLVLPNILTKSTKMLVVVQVDKDKTNKVNGGRLVIKSHLSSLGFSHPRAITDSRLGLDLRRLGPIGQEMSKIVTISDWLHCSELKRLEPATRKRISPNSLIWHSLTR